MDAYDPLDAPDPEAWLSLDEDDRLSLVAEYHRRAGDELPNLRVHAAVHVIVENQAAEGDALPTRATLDRLMREGLDRHDALHAVGGVVIGLINEKVKEGAAPDDFNAELAEELRSLTAAGWLAEFE